MRTFSFSYCFADEINTVIQKQSWVINRRRVDVNWIKCLDITISRGCILVTSLLPSVVNQENCGGFLSGNLDQQFSVILFITIEGFKLNYSRMKQRALCTLYFTHDLAIQWRIQRGARDAPPHFHAAFTKNFAKKKKKWLAYPHLVSWRTPSGKSWIRHRWFRKDHSLHFMLQHFVISRKDNKF